MDHETLYTASKWDILKRLETGPASPLELSQVCKTSIANISQQLRLLEMAGLVTSTRISNRDKGKPRILYRLAGDLSYLIATTGNFVEKKALTLSDRNKVIMRIWFSAPPELRYSIERAFWEIERHFPKMRYLAFSVSPQGAITFHVRFDGKPVALAPISITDPTGTARQIAFTDAVKRGGVLHVLHDPQGAALQQGEKNAQ